jgi:hypothetical protein
MDEAPELSSAERVYGRPDDPSCVPAFRGQDLEILRGRPDAGGLPGNGLLIRTTRVSKDPRPKGAADVSLARLHRLAGAD